MKNYAKITVLMIFVLIPALIGKIEILAESPSLSYSTLIGGSSDEYGHAIAVDEKGFVYLAGQVSSINYPTTTGAFDRTYNGGADILVTKLNQNGSGLVYSTFIGGSGFDDTRKIFLDKSGCVYLTGNTGSANFPITDNSLAGSSEGFFLMLSSNGDSLKYSSRWAGGEKLMVDSDGNLIILGSTNSNSFPTTENAYSRTSAGGNDLFVAKIDIRTNTVLFSTLIGGIGDEGSSAMVLDKQNNIIIAGYTGSENYPVTGNTFAKYDSGKTNVFVTKLKSDGSELLFSTIIGGSDYDSPWDVALDQYENIYVTGLTMSSDFPVTSSAYDTSYNTGEDAILFKMNPDASQLIYSTYIGGSDKDGARGLVVDNDGKVYITGYTRSTDFPVSSDAYDNSYNGGGREVWSWGDSFLLVMNPEGTNIEYSTYFGGKNDEEPYGIAMDKNGGVYLCGITPSNNFPTTEGAYSRTWKGFTDIYVVKFQFKNVGPATPYFGITPPKDIPEKFSVYPSGNFPGLHSCPSFSPSGDEAFWATWPNLSNYKQTIYQRKFENGQWNVPSPVAFSNNTYSDKLPCFSGDGKRVYFTSDRPLSGNGTPIDENIWYIEKNDTGWSNPICLESNVNSSQDDAWISVAKNNNLYFGRNDKLYFAKWENDHYLPAEVLPILEPDIDVVGCIAPDESYIILQSFYRENYSIDDLYIILKKDSSWQTPVKLDAKINSQKSKCFAKISPDGKYLFFLGDNNDAYWVSTDFVNSITGIDEKSKFTVPSTIELNQNYPNPFNPSTVISYQLPASGNVRLKIYDILGQEIKTLADEFQNAGQYSVKWDATDNRRIQVSSGVYFYSLSTDAFSLCKKMILIR